AVLIGGPVLEGDDAPLRSRLRLALVHDFRLGVDRVAVEHGLRELDLLEPEIAHGRAERRLADRQADGDAERQQAVDQRLAEFRLGRRVEVDVQWLGIHRQAREEHIVRFRHGTAGLMAKRLPDLELLEVFPGHGCLLPTATGRRGTLGYTTAPWRTPTTSRSSGEASCPSRPPERSASARPGRVSASSRKRPSSRSTRRGTTAASSTLASTTSPAPTRRSSASRAPVS